MSADSEPLSLPLLVHGAERASADRQVLRSVTGAVLAEVDQAPPLLVRRLLAQPGGQAWAHAAPADRAKQIADAVTLFAQGEPAGEEPEEYDRRVALATGLPVQVTERARAELVDLAAGLATLIGDELAEHTYSYGSTLAQVRRIPRASTLAVIAPSNHPAVHGSWLRALAYGMRVAVRSGGRDPFTPSRLGRALAEVGGGDVPLLVLAGSHDSGRALLGAAGLGLVYGDGATVAEYQGRADIAVRGPGNSKALVTGPPTEELLDRLAEAVAGDAGVRCTNVSQVFTDHDPAALAAGLAERLDRLPALPPTDRAACLPVRSAAAAEALSDQVTALAVGARQHGAKNKADLGDGSAALRPVVLEVPSAAHPAVGVELPFPFVVVAPWKPEDGTAPLRHSLVLLLLGDRPELISDLADAAAADPTVHKLITAPVPPWWTRAELPHEGHLADFLLQATSRIHPARDGQ
jgi:Aldehyde dehydrogenase family